MADATGNKRTRLRDIIAERSLLAGRFKLASGGSTEFYFDMKPTMLDPEGISLMAELIIERLADCEFDCIGGLALGAIPIVAAVVQQSHRAGRPTPGFYVRKEQKERGAERLIDGNLPAGARVVIVEDVTTKGTSSLKAVEAVRAAGATVVKVLTIVDRLEGAAANLREAGLELAALYTTKDFA
jgi:orotate phosphoribosyltransferase